MSRKFIILLHILCMTYTPIFSFAAVPNKPTGLKINNSISPQIPWFSSTDRTYSWTYSDPEGDPQTQWEIHTHIRGDRHQGSELNVHTYNSSGRDGDCNYSNIQSGSEPFTTNWNAGGGITETRGVLYDWFVRVRDKDGWSDWSDAGHFYLDSLPQEVKNISIGSGAGVESGSKVTIQQGNTIHIAKTGSNSGDGSSENPYLTIQEGYNAAQAGDTILVHAGLYKEEVRINKTNPANAPITIKAASGEEVKVETDRSAYGAAFVIDSSANNIIDGFVIQNSGGTNNIGAIFFRTNISNHYLTIKNNKFINNISHIWVNGENAKIINNDFSSWSHLAIIIRNYNCEIRNNYFHDSSGTASIMSGTGCIIRNNVFRNLSSRFIIWGYGMYNARIESNLIYESTPTDWAVELWRQNNAIVANNTIVGLSSNKLQRALTINSSHSKIYNNLIVNAITGILEKISYIPDNSDLTKNDYKYNAFYDVDTVMSTSDPKDIFSANYPGNIKISNPQFADEANGDLTLSLTSPLIDAGPPESPVPVGGGTRRDIGAFEYGATPWAKFNGSTWIFSEENYQSKFTTSDTTPTIIGEYYDTDTLYGYNNTQTGFQILIDTSSNFDSPNLIDSGKVSSSSTSWTVPSSLALSNGKYYLKIRVADNIEADHFGTWSDINLAFTVSVNDSPSPSITTPTISNTYSTANNTIDISGTASDNVGVTNVTWSVSFNSVEAGSGTATGTDNWSVSNIPLSEGDNIITVTAHDAESNTGTDTLTVTYTSPTDNVEPTITITTPTTLDTYSSAIDSFAVGGTASDNVGVTSVTWSVSFNSVEVDSGTATGTDNWSVSNIPLSEGNNIITVTAHDAASNTGTDTLTVAYSSTTEIKEYICNSSLPLSLFSSTLPEEGTLSVNITDNPADALAATLVVTYIDADSTEDGYLSINGDTNTISITADKVDPNWTVAEHSYTIDKALLSQGINNIKFTHVATGGYEVQALKIRLKFSTALPLPSAVKWK